MTHTALAAAPRKTGAVFWPVVAIALLFHAFAAFDHVMTLVQGETYLRASGMSPSQVAYFSDLPLWATAAWTLSVWAGLLGSLALLARRPMAAPLFVAATAGTAAYLVWAFGLSGGAAAMGAAWFMPPLVALATLALAAYARRVAA